MRFKSIGQKYVLVTPDEFEHFLDGSNVDPAQLQQDVPDCSLLLISSHFDSFYNDRDTS